MKLAFFSLMTFLLSAVQVTAVSDPLENPNNRFGIHITHKEDLEKAAELINSNGGDWGYVTFVIREDNRDLREWQEMFDRMRELHLIPIVRIATKMEPGHWKRPLKEDAIDWVRFLNSLNWVVKNRYVVLFNEPNHAKEWGGSIDPVNFAEVSRAFVEALKDGHPDYFVLPAALDLAADNNGGTLTAPRFFDEVYKKDPEFFTRFDGWNSHSYPNPHFSASPQNTGQKSVRGYAWELSYLKKYKLSQDLPIFITETGWQHGDGKVYSRSLLNSDVVAKYMKTAFDNAWNHPRIAAVTPFILNYSEPPFDNFRWVKEDGASLPQFDVVKDMAKPKGSPHQDVSSSFIKRYMPDSLVADDTYMMAVRFENTGQTIWDQNNYSLVISGSLPDELVSIQSPSITKPGQVGVYWLTIKAPENPDVYTLSVQMKQETGGLFGEVYTQTFKVAGKGNVFVKTKLWLQRILHPKDLIVEQFFYEPTS